MAEKFDVSWFELSKYESTKDFGLKEWYRELSIRSIYWQYLHNEMEFDRYGDFDEDNITLEFYEFKESCAIWIEKIKKTPLIMDNVQIDDLVGSVVSIPAYNFWSITQEHEYDLEDVWEVCELLFYGEEVSTTQYELAFTPIDTLLNERTIDGHRCVIEEIKTLSGVNKEIRYIASYRFVNAEIDLAASDEKIINDFKSWLGDRRNEFDYHFKKTKARKVILENRPIKIADIKRWHQNKLLPYIDLMLVFMENKKTQELDEFTKSEIGELLFKDDLDINVETRVRDTVEPWVKWLMKQQTIEAMQSQMYVDG
jgi:hypothetical protein